jgi:hypothetical protein
LSLDVCYCCDDFFSAGGEFAYVPSVIVAYCKLINKLSQPTFFHPHQG